MTTAIVLTVLAGVVAVIAAAVYFFGIPDETKRNMERAALKTMGENKMSYMAKDQINKLPTSDQQDLNNLKKGLGNTLGGVVNNPIGEAGGRYANQALASVHDFSRAAMDRANEMRRKSRDMAQKEAEELRAMSGRGADKAAEGAHYTAGKTVEGVHYTAGKTAEGAHYTANKTAEGAHHAAGKTTEGAHYAADKTTEGAHRAADKADDKVERKATPGMAQETLARIMQP